MAGRTRRALINTAFQGVGQLITWTLTWVLLILLPNALGDAGFGTFFYAFTYCLVFSTLINLGVNSLLVREVAVLWPGPEHAPAEAARRHATLNALLGNVLALKIVVAAGVYLLLCLVILLWSKDEATRQAVLIVGLGTCLGAITPAFAGVFQGRERMLVPTLALIAEKALTTAGCAVLLWLGYGLLAVCWVHTVAAVLQLAIQAICLFRRQPFRLTWDGGVITRLLRQGLPFFVWAVFGAFYAQINVFMLEHLTSTAVVGWHGAACRLYATLFFIPAILCTSVFPALVRLNAESTDARAFARANERLMNLLLFATIPISFGTIAIAKPLIAKMYPAAAFQHAADNLQILGFAMLLVSVGMVLGTVLFARGLEKQWAGMAVLAACFNPLANYLLIPYASRRWGNGGIGASWATVLTELLMVGGALWLMPRGIFSWRSVVVGLKGVVLGLGMVLLLRSWGTQSLVLLVVAGMLFYLPLALVFQVLPREDLHHLWHALTRHPAPGPSSGAPA